MAQSVLVELEVPGDWRNFRLPPALHDRLQELLDRQDRDGKLSPRERKEATALTELVDMLSLMRLRRSGGETTSEENLALACVTCSLRKAARTHARDPRTRKSVPLFHPRRDRWSDHFRWTDDCHLIGRTPTGRATITALGMNRLAVIKIRRALAILEQLGH